MLARVDACAAPPPRFAGLAPAPLAVSLASSDSACSINRTLRRALDFLAPSTRLVVHIGCGSPATTEERKALGAISPRAIVNPRCESVDPTDGTLLHAHLLNMRVLSAAPPGAVLLASADMRWLAPGVEAAVARRVSSAHRASWLPWEVAWEAIPPNRLVVQKHEGSFYPWPVIARFLAHMCARAGLGRRGGTGLGRRLRQLRAQALRPGLSLAAEESLLPTFAATLLNCSGHARGSVRELDETLDEGVLCGFPAVLGREQCGSGHRRARSVPVRVCADCGASRRRRPCVGEVVFARKDEGEGAHTTC